MSVDLVSGFPKNLAYTLKQLSNFTKQTVKVIPDRVNAINFGDVSRFKLPASAMIGTFGLQTQFLYNATLSLHFR